MGKEFELKYAANQQAQAAIATEFGGFETIAMQTTYYDTPDGALAARHITLRRRLENGVSICTLKTPTGGLSRGEWEMECGEIEDAVSELCKLSGWDLLPMLEKAGVIPVCGARFTRQVCTAAVPECTVEIALDRGILTGGGRELPLCEVEVELKDGCEEAAAAFAGSLAQRYGLLPEYKSKFKRALALAKGE